MDELKVGDKITNYYGIKATVMGLPKDGTVMIRMKNFCYGEFYHEIWKRDDITKESATDV